MKTKPSFRFRLPKVSMISLIVFWMRSKASFKKFRKEFNKVFNFFFLVMVGWFLSLTFYKQDLSDSWLTYTALTVLCGMFSFIHWYMLKTRDFENPVLLFYPTIFSAVFMFFITSFSAFSVFWTILIAAIVYSDIRDEKKVIKDEQTLAKTKKELSDLVSENDFKAKGYES